MDLFLCGMITISKLHNSLLLTKALAKFGRTVKCCAFDRYQSVVFGLTFSNPPADLATLLVCWLVWWLHGNFRSLICASVGRTQQQIPKHRQCSTLGATGSSLQLLLPSKNENTIFICIKFLICNKHLFSRQLENNADQHTS